MRRRQGVLAIRVSTVVLGLAAATTAPERAVGQYAADRWAAAIREQQDAIATNGASRARCGPANDPRCAALNERARLMQENLARLQRQHAAMVASPFGRYQPRPEQTQRVAPPGRYEPPPGVASRQETHPRQNRNLFSFLFDGTSARQRVTLEPREPQGGEDDSGELRQSGEPSRDGDYGAWSGNYRTLCVRTCDGFFFPVSFNASRSRLKTDANVCRSLCPATETRLYYHDANGQEAEDAIAADDGTPLAKLANAFAYRRKVVPGCTCGTPDLHAIPAGAGGLAGTRETEAFSEEVAPMPRARPTPDEDPETQLVQISGISTDPVAPMTHIPDDAEAKIAAGRSDEPPKVRIVGPKWFSDR